MGIQTAFFRWLLPAAFVLPLWLLVGFFVSGANGWAIFWVVLVAMPSVFLGQLLFALLIRSRPWVARNRAVSWLDIAVMGSWHVVTVLVGLYSAWFPLLLTLAVIGAIGVLISSLGQLWAGAKSLRVDVPFPRRNSPVRPAGGRAPQGSATGSASVFVVTEKSAHDD